MGQKAVGEALQMLGEKFSKEQGIKEDEIVKNVLKKNLEEKLKT